MIRGLLIFLFATGVFFAALYAMNSQQAGPEQPAAGQKQKGASAKDSTAGKSCDNCPLPSN